MHEKVVQEQSEAIAGVHLSFTPYTLGWRANPDEYIQDFSNAIRTYRSFIEQGTVGEYGVRIDVRFRPDIQIGQLTMTELTSGYTAVRCQGYTLVIKSSSVDFPAEGVEAVNVIGNIANIDEKIIQELFEETHGHHYKILGGMAKKGIVLRYENKDGEYYGFASQEAAQHTASRVYYYPQTNSRRHSGVLDESLPFHNSLVHHVTALGYEYGDELPHATHQDTQTVLDVLTAEVVALRPYSPSRSTYIQQEVLPLVSGLITAYENAGIDPRHFFNPM